jgi:hypothetical protein
MISMSSSQASLSRRNVAQTELDGAIRNFFIEADLIAAHLLGWAALDVISDLAKARGRTTLRVKMKRLMNSTMQKQWSRVERDHYNFMKHADRDPDRTVRLLPSLTAFAIYTACRDFLAVFGTNTPSMAIYIAWFLNRNPDMASTFDASHRDLIDEFGVTEAEAWAEAQTMLRVALENPDEFARLENIICTEDLEKSLMTQKIE